MPMPIRPMLTHAGIRVWEFEPMRRFYTQALGLIVSDEGVGPTTGLRFAFMTADPTKHHQFVLVEGRPRDERSTVVFQLSFKLDSLSELRELSTRAEAAGATSMRPMSHGNAWSVYVDDPEGNTIELYVDTPWYVPQPFGDPLDLSLDDEQIAAQTERRCRSCEGFLPLDEWQAVMRERLGG